MRQIDRSKFRLGLTEPSFTWGTAKYRLLLLPHLLTNGQIFNEEITFDGLIHELLEYFAILDMEVIDDVTGQTNGQI